MKKFLVVDDIKGWRDYHAEMIRQLCPDELDIVMAESAEMGYNKLLENIKHPFDVIITDLQMESDYTPEYAGEWLVRQIKSLNNYYRTKIFIVSASYNIEHIAKSLGVEYIRKSTARTSPDVYKKILQA